MLYESSHPLSYLYKIVRAEKRRERKRRTLTTPLEGKMKHACNILKINTGFFSTSKYLLTCSKNLFLQIYCFSLLPPFPPLLGLFSDGIRILPHSKKLVLHEQQYAHCLVAPRNNCLVTYLCRTRDWLYVITSGIITNNGWPNGAEHRARWNGAQAQ